MSIILNEWSFFPIWIFSSIGVLSFFFLFKLFKIWLTESLDNPRNFNFSRLFILSLKNYPHSLDNYQLPNKVIEHCKDLNNPSYLLNINLKSSEKK